MELCKNECWFSFNFVFLLKCMIRKPWVDIWNNSPSILNNFKNLIYKNAVLKLNVLVIYLINRYITIYKQKVLINKNIKLIYKLIIGELDFFPKNM